VLDAGRDQATLIALPAPSEALPSELRATREEIARIHILGKLSWPPAEKAVAVVKERMAALMATGNSDWDALQERTFEEMEGVDISAIWVRPGAATPHRAARTGR
jgi:hypothetical protein